MPMTRVLLAVCCTLLPFAAWAQRTPRAVCPAGAGATCSASLPVFDFGRRPMDENAPPILGTNSIRVTCVHLDPKAGAKIDIDYHLNAVPSEPSHHMRNNDLGYLRYYLFVDANRTKHWGDGVSFGTFSIDGSLKLDDRNTTATNTHMLYGTVDGQQVVQPGMQLGLIGAQLEYQVSCK